MSKLDVYVTRAATATPEAAHKRRVIRVQSILYDLCAGHITRANAERMLTDAGVSPECAKGWLESAAKNVSGVR